MVQLCKKCSRANPPEAVYCYFDGFVLGGHERAGGPVAAGAKPFASPFVFPTGRACRNFDELAVACQDEWDTACGLLRDGYLESFFGGLGRADLAQAAKEASRFPDPDRGLDGLLAKLLRHEHAPLALAQRCSAVAAPTPLFGAALNYRHSPGTAEAPGEGLRARKGIESLGIEERTTNPFALAVDDLGEGFVLTAQVRSPIDPERICAFMHTALEQLSSALESAPTTPV